MPFNLERPDSKRMPHPRTGYERSIPTHHFDVIGMPLAENKVAGVIECWSRASRMHSTPQELFFEVSLGNGMLGVRKNRYSPTTTCMSNICCICLAS